MSLGISCIVQHSYWMHCIHNKKTMLRGRLAFRVNPLCFLAALCLDFIHGLPPLPIQLGLKQACSDWVLLTYQPNPPLPASLVGTGQMDNSTFSCDLTYWLQHTDDFTSIRVLYNFPTASQDILICNLTSDATYSTFMSCNQQFRSNNFTFKAGSVCADDSIMKHTERDETVYSNTVLEEKGLAQMSTIDISLGVIFGILGAFILAAAAFYLWKHHQHRQRILHLFRQTHRDPFEALHSTEESSILSL